MEIITIKDKDGKSISAEYRGSANGTLVALYRDFYTAKLIAVKFKRENDTWVSPEGFTCDYEYVDENQSLLSLPEKFIKIDKYNSHLKK